MDNKKVHDPRLKNRNNSLIHMLGHKPKNPTSNIRSHARTYQPRYIMPNYSFIFRHFTVTEHVEYEVEMVEWFYILGKRV